jgi:putative phosphoesterase
MIAVIADVHSNLEALKKVLSKISNLRGCEFILDAGDIVGYNTRPNECVELVRKHSVRSVMGNHDRAGAIGDYSGMNPLAIVAARWNFDKLEMANRNYLYKLPERLEIEQEGKRIVVMHGSPRQPLHDYVFPWVPDEVFAKHLHDAKADILILGHTHIPFVKKLESGLVLNPGSVGQPRDHNRKASYALLDVKLMDAKIMRVDYNIPKVSDEVVKAELPDFLAERLFFGM